MSSLILGDHCITEDENTKFLDVDCSFAFVIHVSKSAKYGISITLPKGKYDNVFGNYAEEHPEWEYFTAIVPHNMNDIPGDGDIRDKKIIGQFDIEDKIIFARMDSFSYELECKIDETMPSYTKFDVNPNYNTSFGEYLINNGYTVDKRKITKSNKAVNHKDILKAFEYYKDNYIEIIKEQSKFTKDRIITNPDTFEISVNVNTYMYTILNSSGIQKFMRVDEHDGFKTIKLSDKKQYEGYISNFKQILDINIEVIITNIDIYKNKEESLYYKQKVKPYSHIPLNELKGIQRGDRLSYNSWVNIVPGVKKLSLSDFPNNDADTKKVCK